MIAERNSTKAAKDINLGDSDDSKREEKCDHSAYV